MLVVISDIHLVDGTAGDHNVDGAAFELWCEEIVTLTEEAGATELVFLYLGDMVDLIRTEAWFQEALKDRPWGRADVNDAPLAITDRCKARALSILDGIEAQAGAQLAALAGRWKPEHLARLRALNIPVRRLYVPGNHDRLYCVVPEIRARIDAMLGIDPSPYPGLSLHAFVSQDYGVVARHGHEFDVWNFEGYKHDLKGDYTFADADYLKVPIGDPITTELVARLPLVVKQTLGKKLDAIHAGAGGAGALVERVYKRLQDIENVRPLYAAVQWIYYTALDLTSSAALSEPEKAAVTEAVEESMKSVFEDFWRLPFVAAWVKKHDTWKSPVDEADKLQGLHGLIRAGVKLDTIQFFLKELSALGLDSDDPQRDGAFAEPLLKDAASGVHYAIYGHTHQFDQVALRTIEGHEKVYFNSGTWRPRFHRAQNEIDFAEWKEMTYLIFYSSAEDRLRDPAVQKGTSFETWTGTMLKRARSGAGR